MKGERWLLRLGEALVRAATARLPRRVRGDRYREWTAELPVILHDPDGGSWPRRAARMLGYALDTIRGTTVMPQTSRHRGAYRDSSELGAVLGAYGRPAGLVLVGLTIYFMATANDGFGLWVTILVTQSIALAGYAIRRRRKTSRPGPKPTFWASASVAVIAVGYAALTAAKDSYVRAGPLHVVTLASYGADVAGAVCATLSLVAAARLLIRRRTQRAAGLPNDPPA